MQIVVVVEGVEENKFWGHSKFLTFLIHLNLRYPMAPSTMAFFFPVYYLMPIIRNNTSGAYRFSIVEEQIKFTRFSEAV